jgi:hypothetical protein
LCKKKQFVVKKDEMVHARELSIIHAEPPESHMKPKCTHRPLISLL